MCLRMCVCVCCFIMIVMFVDFLTYLIIIIRCFIGCFRYYKVYVLLFLLFVLLAICSFYLCCSLVVYSFYEYDYYMSVLFDLLLVVVFRMGFLYIIMRVFNMLLPYVICVFLCLLGVFCF